MNCMWNLISTFFLSHLLPLVSLSPSTLWLHDASAGAGLSGGREWGGPAVQDYFSGDSRRCEYSFLINKALLYSVFGYYKYPLILMVVSSLLLFPLALWPFSQDMEITANELKNVLNRVITKRESRSINRTVSKVAQTFQLIYERWTTEPSASIPALFV